MSVTDQSKGGVDAAPSLAHRPLLWICGSVVGFVLLCLGVIIEVYRHEHGAAAGALIGRSNPGVLIALVGIGMMATGLLVAMSLLLFHAASSVKATLRIGAAVVVVWVAVGAVAAGAVTYAATADITVGHEGHEPALRTAAASNSETTSGPRPQDRASLRGVLTLDGAPFDARFLGVRVMRDGLATACQQTIPAVTQGRYEISVLADAEVRGCGTAGAELLLWTFVNDGFLFSQQTLPWPGDGAVATFDATFSSALREGASKPVAELKGHLFDRDGVRMPGGTEVEAYVGDVLCGVTSLRYEDDFDVLYTLIIAGPESVTGCEGDATLTFRIGGAPAVGTALNDLGRGEDGRELDLTVE